MVAARSGRTKLELNIEALEFFLAEEKKIGFENEEVKENVLNQLEAHLKKLKEKK